MDLVRSIESQREREKREERREIKSGVGAFERRRGVDGALLVDVV